MPSVVMSTSGAEIMPRNSTRKSFIILNEDTSDSVYIKAERAEDTNVSSTVHDFKLAPGASIGLNTSNDGEETIHSRWTGVASANTPRISWFETEDIIR